MASLTDSCRPPTYSVVFGLLPLPLTTTVVLCMAGPPVAGLPSGRRRPVTGGQDAGGGGEGRQCLSACRRPTGMARSDCKLANKSAEQC